MNKYYLNTEDGNGIEIPFDRLTVQLRKQGLDVTLLQPTGTNPHVSGRSEQFYCVSSDALVYGKGCEKWCGDQNCKALVKQ